MKYLISLLVVACVSVVCVFGAPQGDPYYGATVQRYENDLTPDNGGYRFVYELSDGQIRAEAGAVRDLGEEKPIVVTGAYSFFSPDGQRHWVTYTADEYGFHPQVGSGQEGGFKPGDDVGIDPNALKSLIG